MKKINLTIGILLILLVGCSSTDVVEEEIIVLPTLVLEESIPMEEVIYIGEKEIRTEVIDFEFNDTDFVSISNKVVKNNLVYNSTSDVPFTGKFVMVIGDQIYYTEEYVEGKLTGLKEWFSEVGVKVMKEPYVNNKINGTQETYYDISGNIRSKVNYVDNKIIGKVEWFMEDGTILENIDLVDGNGEFKSFWGNGNIKEVGNLKSGIRTGEWKAYRENGELEKITKYNSRGVPSSQRWFEQ